MEIIDTWQLGCKCSVSERLGLSTCSEPCCFFSAYAELVGRSLACCRSDFDLFGVCVRDPCVANVLLGVVCPVLGI